MWAVFIPGFQTAVFADHLPKNNKKFVDFVKLFKFIELVEYHKTYFSLLILYPRFFNEVDSIKFFSQLFPLFYLYKFLLNKVHVIYY